MNTAPDTVMFCAANKDVLFVRQHQGENAWGLPKIGTIEHGAQLQPWTDGAVIARVDSAFDPVGIEHADYFWCCPDFAITCTAVEPSARAALRRFDGDLLDQIMALIEGRADSAINSKLGDLQVNTATRADYTAAQAKADRVAHAFGDSAPPQLAGESLHDYKVRLAKPYQQYSKIFKTTDLNKIGDMSGIEDAIYNDALAEAAHPTMFQPGELRAVHTPDATGRKITKYYGDPNIVWDQFNQQPRYVTKFNTAGRA